MIYISVGYACCYRSSGSDEFDFDLLFFEVEEMPDRKQLIEMFKQQYEFSNLYSYIKIISINQHDFNSWNKLKK